MRYTDKSLSTCSIYPVSILPPSLLPPFLYFIFFSLSFSLGWIYLSSNVLKIRVAKTLVLFFFFFGRKSDSKFSGAKENFKSLDNLSTRTTIPLCIDFNYSAATFWSFVSLVSTVFSRWFSRISNGNWQRGMGGVGLTGDWRREAADRIRGFDEILAARRQS